MFGSPSITDELVTIRDYLRFAVSCFHQADIFCGHGTDSLWDEATYLVFHGARLPIDADQRVLDARLTLDEKKRILNLIEKRSVEKIPAPYLTNEAWFCGLSFYVDERVLIPRSPMAELIEQGFQPWIENEKGYGAWLGEDAPVHRILDLCTGSGCIGIACAMAFPDAQIDIVDISSDALKVAQVNVDKHGVTDQVCVIESDLFAALGNERYDIIISNPPYVDEAEIDDLPPEYHHEPMLGLAAGKDGLDIVKKILKQAGDHLTENGILVVEVGISDQALIDQYPDVPFTWLEFERGGNGVFLLTAQQVKECASQF